MTTGAHREEIIVAVYKKGDNYRGAQREDHNTATHRSVHERR